MTEAIHKKGNKDMRATDPLEVSARELAVASGIDPDSRVPHPTKSGRTAPAWTTFRAQAYSERTLAAAAAVKELIPPQAPDYQNAPLQIFGTHEDSTLAQMQNCMGFGNVVAGAICADGHLGYAQPVGGVIAYEDQISVSGVGFDIACGNLAVRLDTPYAAIKNEAANILSDIRANISFGIGRANNERVAHELFDDKDMWLAAGMEDFRQKAEAQLGTVGSGNHYVDLLEDQDGMVWIGIHFGSRGLGHTTATRMLKLAGGKDGIHVAPTVLPVHSDLGQQYLAGMKLAGRYAYAGREWVAERVRSIIGGNVTATVHNHHNYAWFERHYGRALWVVRKGATPAFPGQLGFVGGSMGDNAVIIEGVDSDLSQRALYSTIHGAGRTFGRKEAKRRFTRAEMDAWLRDRGVLLSGGDLDESPMAYRRLPEVLDCHAGTVRILHTLRPFVVAMAGEGDFDPFKD